MNTLKSIFTRSKSLILYAVLLAFLVFVLKWLQWKFLIVDNSMEIYIGLIAGFFTILGIWVATQLVKPKIETVTETVIIEKEIFITRPEEFSINQQELEKLKLSTREYEILQLLARGCSNADMAASLFLSLSTIKTHVSNLYFKMDVKSRTQAIEKAKRLNIID